MYCQENMARETRETLLLQPIIVLILAKNTEIKETI